ncbi:unnamed protein product [Ilex paraguariensis]|uniref:Uncharacterized protein n=1 Tax=Ilex paraguariensis TaxID=185542 RepID=A0ABC8V1R3_9AQUA
MEFHLVRAFSLFFLFAFLGTQERTLPAEPDQKFKTKFNYGRASTSSPPSLPAQPTKQILSASSSAATDSSGNVLMLIMTDYKAAAPSPPKSLPIHREILCKRWFMIMITMTHCGRIQTSTPISRSSCPMSPITSVSCDTGSECKGIIARPGASPPPAPKPETPTHPLSSINGVVMIPQKPPPNPYLASS